MQLYEVLHDIHNIRDKGQVRPLHIVSLEDRPHILQEGIVGHGVQPIHRFCNERRYILFKIGLVLIVITGGIYQRNQCRVQQNIQKYRSNRSCRLSLIALPKLANRILNHVDGCSRFCHKRSCDVHKYTLGAHITRSCKHRIVDLGPVNNLGESFSGNLQKFLGVSIHSGIAVSGLVLNCVPDLNPSEFVSLCSCFGKDLPSVVAVREEALRLFAESMVLLCLQEIHSRPAHSGIKIAHFLDHCHRSMFLQFFP